MKKIDRETVQKILDTANIVDVVSDFVHLKRRGANYIGLCPFHNERTPSFSVSKAKNICKCFSCGKGGSPVNFIMEHEQLSFNEALRFLAKKYNIEIKEHEMSDKEREEATERESMLAANEFALNHFEHNLNETPDGQAIGLSYFRERGINDVSIKRFRLGYSIDSRDDLLKTATNKGYKEKYLVDTGLCIKNDAGKVYDRFKGRVMYPVFSISGKVVAFGGRTLRKDKDVAKYVNSPESLIYRKSYELYGLYQAKQAIVKKDKCILVEGYMDVISMHQSGIENVVASSGTSLTEGQIRMIHRFTENVTVIYDSDPAGIKASLRGIDMLLAEGLNIKVLLLPDGDDPDSFAQSHTSSELEEYLATHETDFISFKTSILMQGAENDPVQRSRAIADIVRSISVIPNELTRTIYIKECSRSLEIDEKVLTRQVAKYVAERREKDATTQQRQQAAETIEPLLQESTEVHSTQVVDKSNYLSTSSVDKARYFAPYERETLRYVLKYGMLDFCSAVDDEGNTAPMKVIDYIASELINDGMKFTNYDCAITFDAAVGVSQASWAEDLEKYKAQLLIKREKNIAEGEELIRQTALDLADIKVKETQLIEKCDNAYNSELTHYTALYIERALLSDPDDVVRRLATDLVSEKHVLSKVHTKYAQIATEQDQLDELIPKAVFGWKNAIIEWSIKELIAKISTTTDAEQQRELIIRLQEKKNLKKDFDKYLGERVVAPRK